MDDQRKGRVRSGRELHERVQVVERAVTVRLAACKGEVRKASPAEDLHALQHLELLESIDPDDPDLTVLRMRVTELQRRRRVIAYWELLRQGEIDLAGAAPRPLPRRVPAFSAAWRDRRRRSPIVSRPQDFRRRGASAPFSYIASPLDLVTPAPGRHPATGSEALMLAAAGALAEGPSLRLRLDYLLYWLHRAPASDGQGGVAALAALFERLYAANMELGALEAALPAADRVPRRAPGWGCGCCPDRACVAGKE